MLTNPPTSKPDLRPPLHVRSRMWWGRLLWLMLLGALFWATFGTDISLRGLYDGVGSISRFLFGDPANPNRGSFFPPNFARFDEYFQALLVTLKTALWGTCLAAVAGIPLAYLGAANTSPHPTVYFLTRRLLDLLRGLDDFILGLIFVAAVGLGPFPAILALFVHTSGILGKLYAEGIEGVDPGQIEAVKASGASGFQVFTHGVWPQVVPHVASVILYRFESNVRGATILSLVGAGGIGLYLQEALRGFDKSAACAVVLMIVANVLIIDTLSAQIRKRLV